jgi:tetratricopeptide (TPR) repeat protein
MPMGMVKSPFYIKNKPMTRADELNDRLTQLEAKIGRMGHGMGQEALTIPLLLDEINAILAELQAKGQKMRAEEARLETASAALGRKAAIFLREIGGADALQEARRARQPDPASWWWFLDQLLAEKRRARLRRTLRLAVGTVATLLVLFALYQLFLAPDPATRERLKHEQTAENLALEGDLASALSEVEQALAVVPEAPPHLLIFKGVLQQELGQSAAAEEMFAAAEAAMGDREAFLLTRGQKYLLLGQAEAAIADAEAATGLNPESAAGYMLLGRANEWLGNYEEAVVAYEQASALAEAQGNAQLAAIARVNMGMLLQQLRAR